jgi:hypothetical protein
MSSDCFKCNKPIATTDEKVICSGACRQNWHLVCTNIGRSLYQYIKPNRNLKWSCDDCMDDAQNLCSKIDQLSATIILLEETFLSQINELKSEIGTIHVKSVTKDTPTYAEKVKLSKNEPLVIVKPKNSKKTGKDTREDVKKKIDTSLIPVKELRNIAGSSVGLECKNSEETENVRKTVAEQMGRDYEVTVAELRYPEIKIVGLFEEPDEADIVSKIKRQNDFITEEAVIEVLNIEKARNRTQTFNMALKLTLDGVAAE